LQQPVVLKKEERLFSALPSTDVEYDLIVTGVHLILDEFPLGHPLVELTLNLCQRLLCCIDNHDVNTIALFVCHGFCLLKFRTTGGYAYALTGVAPFAQRWGESFGRYPLPPLTWKKSGVRKIGQKFLYFTHENDTFAYEGMGSGQV
jgi:hypothetical protein